jgi:hypothetical protein
MRKEDGAILVILISFFFCAIVNVYNANAQTPPTGEDAKRLVGLWRLVSITTNDGKIDPARGVNPKGLIYYAPSGQMIVQISPDRERKLAGPKPTGEEALAALVGYTAYFGTYSIDEKAKIVKHNQWGTVQPGPVESRDRRYEFAPGDRLILKGGNNVLTWERIK